MNEFVGPAQYGWICPRCGKVLAPWMSECNCHQTNTEIITGSATPSALQIPEKPDLDADTSSTM